MRNVWYWLFGTPEPELEPTVIEEIEMNVVYVFHNKDPFKRDARVLPIDVKDGYVQYYYIRNNNSKIGTPTSTTVEDFLLVYTKE